MDLFIINKTAHSVHSPTKTLYKFALVTALIIQVSTCTQWLLLYSTMSTWTAIILT